MAAPMPGLLPLPSSTPALTAELERLERERERTRRPAARRLFAIERRRVVLELDRRRTDEAA